MAIFDRLDRMISRTCDRQFSVGAVIDPMISTPNGRPAADPSRSEMLVRGIFDEAPALSGVEIGARDRKGNDLRALAAGQAFEFSIDVLRHPEAKGARQGDRLTLDDARKYEIVSVSPDGMSRVVLELTRI